MEWIKPQYSKGRVNHAGDFLRKNALAQQQSDTVWNDIIHSIDVLGNWRSSHGYPLNIFQSTLRNKTRNLFGRNSNILIVQRLKRLSSIIAKLNRKQGMKMKLARMQDVGGLRAVVPTLEQVRKLQTSYLNSTRITSDLVRQSDYIDKPKDSGYRGVHLVFRYKGRENHGWDSLYVELQLRTKLQHAWATAVEIVGAFTNEALKSSEGSPKWLDFFSLVGSAFAYMENSNLVPGYDKWSRLKTFQKISKDARTLSVIQHLRSFNKIKDMSKSTDHAGHYHLIVMDTSTQEVRITSYGRRNLSKAAEEYAKEEEAAKGVEYIQVVLVSGTPFANLKRAYPNYFADSQVFIEKLRYIMKQVNH